MKVCPTCDATFTDDSLSYCLHDGTELISGESQPTVIIERAAPTVPNAVAPKSKNTGLMIGLIVVILIFAIVVVAAALLFFYDRKPDTNISVRTTNSNTASPTPKTVTPKPSPSSTPPAAPSPSTSDPAKTDQKSDDSDEVTPISWTTSASTFKTDVGQKYTFECPANGVPEAIWGNDVYTSDSSICTAAVHAGIITVEKGGKVTIEFRPGKSAYGSTERNGITSNTYGEFPHSFVVR